MLSLAVALVWLLPGPDAQSSTSCEYANCIFEGLSRSSGVETYMVNLNFSAIPSNIVKKCELLLARISNCSSFNVSSCPSNVSEPFDRRLYDNRYLLFLMAVGEYSCRHRTKLLDLRVCTTVDVDNSMKTCVNETTRDFDSDCVYKKFLRQSSCNQTTRNVVVNIVRRLNQNPYYT